MPPTVISVVGEIARQLGNWNVWTRQNGIVTISQGMYIMVDSTATQFLSRREIDELIEESESETPNSPESSNSPENSQEARSSNGSEMSERSGSSDSSGSVNCPRCGENFDDDFEFMVHYERQHARLRRRKRRNNG
ncbi:hypothetical protein RCL_jg13790.t1 [Rhizophagus clarus]|uniref:C2H2-type domain-containing protein n=1 Tax=Rhizophagus clarus TaxID=94130 RepID=A0A8H3MGX6_9GLOM|nr:hypothetical protein RCL_jg13790.t1 [Rhizophagus clarus]